MTKYQNYSADGRYYISTTCPHGTQWQTCVFRAGKNANEIDFSTALEEIAHSSEESAEHYHKAAVYRWSGNTRPEDIIGIGEGFY